MKMPLRQGLMILWWSDEHLKGIDISDDGIKGIIFVFSATDVNGPKSQRLLMRVRNMTHSFLTNQSPCFLRNKLDFRVAFLFRKRKTYKYELKNESKNVHFNALWLKLWIYGLGTSYETSVLIFQYLPPYLNVNSLHDSIRSFLFFNQHTLVHSFDAFHILS